MKLHCAEILVARSSVDAVSSSISAVFLYKDVLEAHKVVLHGFEVQILAFEVRDAGPYQIQHYLAAAYVAQIWHHVFDYNHPTLMEV